MTVSSPIAKLEAEAITIEERSPFQVVMRRFVCHGDHIHYNHPCPLYHFL